MTHQVFGDTESIFGYKDLRVNIYSTASTLRTYVNVKYSDKVNADKDGVPPDNIMASLSEYLQPGFITNINDFTARIPKEAAFKPYGEMIHSYKVHKNDTDRTFEIYKTSIEEPGFRDFHERLQPFMMFYIDAASFIDVDDDKWEYYLLFEKYQSNANPMWAIAGYMTVYNYYAYPGMIRPRVSQVLVLPPFQRMGHCATMLQTFYNQCFSNPDIKDITVEDPSENFQRVRDFVDARNCSKLDSFSAKCLREGFSEDMIRDARFKLRINKKQARRIYEILRLKATDQSNKEQVKGYRLDIKKRLNMPFQKNGRDFEKLKRALQPTELSAVMANTTLEQRMEYLQKTYLEITDEYKHVIERLAAS